MLTICYWWFNWLKFPFDWSYFSNYQPLTFPHWIVTHKVTLFTLAPNFPVLKMNTFVYKITVTLFISLSLKCMDFLCGIIFNRFLQCIWLIVSLILWSEIKVCWVLMVFLSKIVFFRWLLLIILCLIWSSENLHFCWLIFHLNFYCLG